MFASHVLEEARLLSDLAFPNVVVLLSGAGVYAMTASYVGRFLGDVFLDGFSLANIVGNLTCLSVLQGVLSASDTLSPQAFGVGNQREVGLIAIRAFLISFLIEIPVQTFVCIYLKDGLIWFGVDHRSSSLAYTWYKIYIITVPFYLLFNVMWKFLSAQGIMKPLIYVCTFSTLCVLPACLRIFLPTMGFVGSAVAVLLYNIIQTSLLLIYLMWYRPHCPDTWPEIKSWKEALRIEPILQFSKLAFGGILASTEWCFWELLCMMAGTFGVIPLSVHTIAAQVVQIAFVLPLGIGIALTIRMGVTIVTNVERAKFIATGCYAFTMILIVIISVALYGLQEEIFSVFTSNEDVVQRCKQVWFSVIFYICNLSIYGINMGILNGLGMQCTLGTTTVICLWLVGLPAIYYVSISKKGGLEALWYAISFPYIMMNLILCSSFIFADWSKISRKIQCMESAKVDCLPIERFIKYDSLENENRKNDECNYSGYSKSISLCEIAAL